jgi:hypothetical protein
MALTKGKSKKRDSKKEMKFDIVDDLVDFDEEELYLSILGYGKNGRGKTQFAGTLPKPVFIDFNEHGTLSIRGKGIKGWRVDDWEQVEKIYWYLQSGEHDYLSVVWDTATQAADIALEHVMGVSSQFDSSAGTLVTQKDWGNMSKEMKYWIIKFRNLPMHKMFLFQEKSLDEDTLEEGEHTVVHAISPAVRSVAGAAVDIIMRFEYVEVKKKVGPEGKKKLKTFPTYRARIGPSERYLTKFRTPEGKKLPQNFIENPTFDKVLELYQIVNS